MSVMLATALVCSPDAFEVDNAASQMTHAYQMSLSAQERDRIWRECHFAVQKMNREMEQAEREARQITNVDIREATIGAIEGAVCGLSGYSPYTVVVGGCLGALARIGGDSYRHFARSKDHVRDAESYARIADALQERLWRDQ